MWRVETVSVGSVEPLGAAGVPSGIVKHPVAGPSWLGREGFTGDAQGDRKFHGGVEKAVHHYPADHYAAWAKEIGDHPALRGPAAFGENIAPAGLVEADVAIGDRFRLGEALVEVSQGRQPCFKLNLRFDVPDMALRVQASGRTGWYYRVIEEGWVEPGAALMLVDRVDPQWTIDRLRRLFYADPLNRDELRAVAGMPHLPERWRQVASRRLETGTAESWAARLYGRT